MPTTRAGAGSAWLTAPACAALPEAVVLEEAALLDDDVLDDELLELCAAGRTQFLPRACPFGQLWAKKELPGALGVEDVVELELEHEPLLWVVLLVVVPLPLLLPHWSAWRPAAKGPACVAPIATTPNDSMRSGLILSASERTTVFLLPV